MKKSITLIFVLTLCLALFVACSPGNHYSPDVGVEDDMMGSVGSSMSSTENLGDNYTYDKVTENGFVSTAEQSSSYFSLDRNTASYTIMRRQIASGMTVAPNSVRLEEYVNYFSYNYPRPTDGKPLAISGSIFDTPYNSNTKMFTIGVSAEQVQFENPKTNNIVFLIDVSGSMFGSDRLGLIQQSFSMLVENLADDDTVSIVTYAGNVRVALEGAKGSQKTHIANVLQDLTASGSTNGEGGIQLAYQVASKYFVKGGNNRVILATDGDFNVGISNKNQLKSFIEQKRESGIYLSVLGVGMYNTNDTTMSTLATNGNGNYAYLDSVAEAYKVLVKELNGTFNVVAKDAKIGVTFNPEVVQNYRLVGYETKMMTENEFQDVKKDAGEIGSGHTVTAVYEITLKEGELDTNAVVATAQLKFKNPESDQSDSVTRVFTLADYTTTPNEDAVFVSCVVEFALILRNSEYKADVSFSAIINRLSNLQCVVKDQFKAEFLDIVQTAASSEKYN